MTEYGVQTNNLFDLLNEGAKPKAKPAAPAGQQQQAKKKAQAPKPQQPAKQAQAPKKPAEQKPAQPKPVATVSAVVPGAADEGFKTVGRSGQTQTGAQSQQAAPAGNRGPQGQQRPRPQGTGSPHTGERRGPVGQGGGQGGQFRQGGQGGQGGQFRQGGQGGQGGQFRQGGQGGQFRQGGQGGQFRQGGQGGQFRQGGGRRDESDRRFDSFDDKEHTHTLPNKNFAEGPRQKEDHGNHPVKAGGNRREFDRISGTGRAPNEQKKGGAGAGNWGKLNADDELKAAADAQAEIAADAEGAAPAADGAEAPKKNKKKGEKEEEEKDKKDELPEEKMVLFDDYLKEKSKKNKVKIALPAARQAGEGEKENAEWASATKLDRPEDQIVFLSDKAPVPVVAKPSNEKKVLSKGQYKKKKERKRAEAARAKLEQDNVVSLFDFSAKKEPERDRERGEGRGDRRGPRGEGRGAPRGDREPRGEGRGDRRGPRPGPGGPKPEGRQGPRQPGTGAPKKFPNSRPADAPQFDASSFPALQLGP